MQAITNKLVNLTKLFISVQIIAFVVFAFKVPRFVRKIINGL